MKEIDFNELKGLRLLGVLGATEENGDENVVYIYIGYADEFECYKASSYNCDWLHYSDWKLERVEPFLRDSRYKAIGEEILDVENFDVGEGYEGHIWGVRLKSVTKVLTFSNINSDCCYVDALWDVL